MLFLKVTRSVKRFAARFGWLIAELVFVFLGMYGAFLLERMHDEDMDMLRKRQILQALVDEFEDYEQELGSASNSLDEAYGVPFFTAYGAGERPFPTPIPYGGMGSVNTGIWEAMLQSGGIEVLEVEMIQQVQVFFKKLQDLLDLYSRFERLTEQMILPEMDQDVSYFYEKEGPELRDKYKWYVNSLFTIGMSLQTLSEQAGATKEVLLAEYEKIREKEEDEKIKYAPRVIPTAESDEESVEEEAEEQENTAQVPSDAHSQAISYLIDQCQSLADFFEATKADYDQSHAVPFLTSYSEGEQPVPTAVPVDLLEGINIKPLADLLSADGVDEVLDAGLLESLSQLVDKISEVQNIHQEFSQRCRSEIISSNDHNISVFYASESTELKENFQWFPNTLYTLGIALEDCQKESNGILALLDGQTLNSEDTQSFDSQSESKNIVSESEANQSQESKDEN